MSISRSEWLKLALEDPHQRERVLAIFVIEAQDGNREALLALCEHLDEPDVDEALLEIPEALIATAWYETRDPRLARGCVADFPPATAVVTALKASQFEPRPELAEELLKACGDADPEVRQRALACLSGDLSGAMRDALFLASVRGAGAFDDLPDDPALQVLSWHLAGRMEEALACDPDGELLRRGLGFLDGAPRLRLAANLRSRGLGHLTTVTMGLDWRFPERVEEGFHQLLPELLAQGRFDELWRLAFLLPVHRTRAIVLALAERGFDEAELLERAVPLAAAPIPAAQPERRLPGRFLAWAGGEIYRLHEGLLLRGHEILRTENSSALPAERLAQIVVSPDGAWFATGLFSFELCQADGTRVMRLESPDCLQSLEFSPCSRYALLTRHHSYDSETFQAYTLIRLSSMEPVFEGTGCAWHWQGEQALLWTWCGPEEVELATGASCPHELPFARAERVWKRSPSGRRWVSSDGSEVRIWEDGAERSFPPGSPDFLADDRLAIAHDGSWSLWDGRRLLSVPGRGKEVLDPQGPRALGGDHAQTEVLRFSEPRLARVLDGRLAAVQGEHIVTERNQEIALWRVPHDVFLGRARLEDVDGLEPHDRELARLFLLERCRHEVQLEDSFVALTDHAIELD